MTPFSQRARRLRRSRGLTQSDLAARVGVNRRTIVALELGRCEPMAGTLSRIADALGVDMGDLWRGPRSLAEEMDIRKAARKRKEVRT